MLVLALLPLAAGCGDGQDSYCAAVKDHQEELTTITGDGDEDSLIRALDIFKDLRDKSPSDVSDEWQQLVSRIETLDGALADAGVDPATYDRDHPPEDLGREDRARIDAAARELGSGPTLAAFEGLQQEVLDVCHTPLTL
ncbi:hypothetical protein GCM10009844_18770 [Nocardioides koreensis]|uniref:Lipoprotein n=1 Tax=Nocardioides koreensis TaxID=433651 RepID=A0ABN2ZN44_9ACTN